MNFCCALLQSFERFRTLRFPLMTGHIIHAPQSHTLMPRLHDPRKGVSASRRCLDVIGLEARIWRVKQVNKGNFCACRLSLNDDRRKTDKQVQRGHEKITLMPLSSRNCVCGRTRALSSTQRTELWRRCGEDEGRDVKKLDIRQKPS